MLNAAAYTAVDAAEQDAATATAVNETGPRLLAEAVATAGGRMVHISTDYVFGGDADAPYEPDDPTGPRTVYGRTKLAGERHVRATLAERSHVVRTAWVHGGPTGNFVDTMRRLERERDVVTVVADQIGSPTWVADLAAAVVELGHSDVKGAVLHYVNAGRASWFELARAVFELAGADPQRVQPIDSASYAFPTPRPAWSVLSTGAWTAAGLTAPRPWREALAAAMSA